MELYKILQLRNQVFVVEQKCPFPDLDNYDQNAYHNMGWLNNTLIAYSRIFDYKQMYSEQSIGRVICDKPYRNSGVGTELMTYSMSECKFLFGNGNIKISAQYQLLGFYKRLGFTSIGHIYYEDGMPHINMMYIAPKV